MTKPVHSVTDIFPIKNTGTLSARLFVDYMHSKPAKDRYQWSHLECYLLDEQTLQVDAIETTWRGNKIIETTRFDISNDKEAQELIQQKLWQYAEELVRKDEQEKRKLQVYMKIQELRNEI